MKASHFIKNYASLTSYDDGVVFMSNVSKFPTHIRARGPKRPSGSRVLFVRSGQFMGHVFVQLWTDSRWDRGTGTRITI